jgi:hypothetical protein
MENPGRALGVAELLKHYTPAQVAAMLSKANKGDVDGALRIAFNEPEKDEDDDRDRRGEIGI